MHGHDGPVFSQLAFDDRRKRIFNAAVKDFITRRDDAGLFLTEGMDVQERCWTGRFLSRCHLILLYDQGNDARTGQFIALTDREAAMAGGNHHFSQRIDGFQPVAPDGQDAVAIGDEFDFPFFRLTAMHIRPQADIAQDGRGFIFMEQGIVLFPDVDVVLADRQQDRDIFLSNHMALAEDRAFGDAADDLGNIVTEDMTDSLFGFHHFHNYLSFHCL